MRKIFFRLYIYIVLPARPITGAHFKSGHEFPSKCSLSQNEVTNLIIRCRLDLAELEQYVCVLVIIFDSDWCKSYCLLVQVA